MLLCLGLLMTACGDAGPQVPDGFQVVDHPRGSVALPADWDRADDAPVIDDVDPDAARYQIPGSPDELQIGATIFAVPSPGGNSEAVAVMYSMPMVNLEDAEQTRREPTEVAGTADATLIEVRAPSPPLDGQEVRGIYVAARHEDGVSLVVRLLGPTDVLTDELVEDVLGSIEVTGG